LSAPGDQRRVLGMTCGQLILLLILLLVALAVAVAGVYWVMTNVDLSGGPALPTPFKVNSPAAPTRTSGPVILPPTWTLTPTVTASATPQPSDTPTMTQTSPPPTITLTKPPPS
jgi:flagellar basal body-associated protein FliL